MEKGILKNILINFVGLVLPTFVSLLTIPLYIKILGVDRYGVINLVWALIGYFSVLDLGVSLATENHIAKARATGDEAVATIFWSACWMNFVTGVIGGALIYFGAYIYTAHVVHLQPEFQHEVLAALPWIALAVPVANVSWVFAGALTGVERFKAFNVNQTLGTFIFQLLPLGAAYLIAPSLAVVIPAAVCARLIAGLMLGATTLRALEIKRLKLPEWPVIRELFGYGKWVIATSGANMIGDSLDRVLVGAMLGAKFVTYYAMPQNLVTRLNLLQSAMLRTLFPRLSAATKDDAGVMVRHALTFLNGAFTPCVIFALFALGPFLTVWVGPELAAESAPVGRIIVIGVWITGQSNLMKILIQAQADPAAVARVSFLELPVFIAALWAGIHFFGIIGAGVAVVMKTVVDYGLFLYFSRIEIRASLENSAAHLAFLLVSLALAGTLGTLPTLAACATVLVSLNVVWSFYSSVMLRDLARQILSRVAS
jgi:O-antigen/teichoic acid export membrane protein